jgi:muconolactone delta-isomerase
VKVDLGWGIVLLLLLAFVVWRLSAMAGRLDRLHHRIELARASLDAQLVRRARAAEALAASGLLDPASAIVLAQAASHSRNANLDDPVERGLVESEMSRDLREVFADPEMITALGAVPEGDELLSDLAASCRQVTLSRRFLNDGVQAARLLRQGRWVRLFRLAGNAPRPEMFEMDDVAPAAFDFLS